LSNRESTRNNRSWSFRKSNNLCRWYWSWYSNL